MWRPLLLSAVLGLAGCSSELAPPGPGDPDDVASIRLYDGAGQDQTRHLFIYRNDTLHLEVRLFARNGRRITEVVGGVAVTLAFDPAGLASSVPVAGSPLVRAVTTTSAPNDTGTVLVSLQFPNAGSRTFGPFECATH